MLTRRVIACLDVKGGRVVKGVRFRKLRDMGDPVELALRYEADGADEITFLDISATVEERNTMLDLVRRTAEQLFIPLTVGGGVRSADDVGAVLRSGADKVAMNSGAVAHPAVITESARRFGSQCVVVSIDARRADEHWEVYTHGGRQPAGLDAVRWAELCVKLGAGEILLTSIDRDGGRFGYDLALTRAVAERVTVPVVASGGAGSAADVVRVLSEADADAALVAGLLHDGTTSISAIKREMESSAIPVRWSANV
jgi:imidazole glycerol-phosphate synthase subunit HisF